MHIYNSSRLLAARNPIYAIAIVNNVATNIHFRPNLSERKPKGTIIKVKIWPMKKQVTKYAILLFDSHNILT